MTFFIHQNLKKKSKLRSDFDKVTNLEGKGFLERLDILINLGYLLSEETKLSWEELQKEFPSQVIKKAKK